MGNGAGINLALKRCKTKFAIYTDIDVKFNKNTLVKLISYAKKIDNFSVIVPNHGNLNLRNNTKILRRGIYDVI